MFLLLAACPSPAHPPPTGEQCAGAEQNLLRLGCKGDDGRPLGQGNKSGESYRQICERVEKEGKVDMRSGCVAQAKSCQEVEQCDQ